MNPAVIVTIITAATAFVTSVATLVKLLQHVNSANPHPNAAPELPPATPRGMRPGP